ncbi:hypothetical protein ACFFX0_13700 [Citricoccus parietis]|uniref:Uncharacterized protein n=1 Tax=Citricoccus parietis TaxID=592307 RepID=A0ABV5FZV3_9MICC
MPRGVVEDLGGHEPAGAGGPGPGDDLTPGFHNRGHLQALVRSADIQPNGGRSGEDHLADDALAHEFDAHVLCPQQELPGRRSGQGVQPQGLVIAVGVRPLGEVEAVELSEQVHVVPAQLVPQAAVLELLPGQSALDPVVPGSPAHRPQLDMQRRALLDVRRRCLVGTPASAHLTARLGQQLHTDPHRLLGVGDGLLPGQLPEHGPPVARRRSSLSATAVR